MKIKKLKVINFLSHADTEFDLDRLDGPVLILGKFVGEQVGKSNGAGKSTLFEAIAWGLFGESRAKSDDELIRTGADRMEVTIIYEIDGVTYEVIRSRKRGKSQSLLFSDLTNDKKLRENSVAATAKAIVRSLGMDYSTFSNTVFSPQNQLAKFPSELPSKRKEVLSSIIGIDVYGDMEEKAKRLASNYERDALALEMNISRSESELGQDKITEGDIDKSEALVVELVGKGDIAKSTLADAEEKAVELRSRVAWHDKISADLSKGHGDLERIEGQIKYAEVDKINRLAAVDSDLKNFQKSLEQEPKTKAIIAEIETKIKSYDEVSARLGTLKEERAGLHVERDGLNREVDASSRELDKLRTKLNQVAELGQRCPLCYSELTPECQAKINEDIIKEGTERRKAHDEKTQRLQRVLARATEIDTEVRTMAGEVERQSELQRDLKRHQDSLFQIEMTKNQIQAIGDRRAEVEKSHQQRLVDIDQEKARVHISVLQLQGDLAKVSYNQGEVAGINAEIVRLQSELATVVDERDRASQSLGAMKSQKEAYDRKIAQVEADRSRLKENKDQEFIYKELTRAFGKNGIPALIMDNALAEVQSEVNKFMEALTGGDIVVEFSTQKELKSGKNVETMDIKVSDSLGTRDFNLYSGGEKARVALAIRLALAKIISRRAGKRIECVFIDEVSDLDQAGLMAFAQMINQIAKDYKQIMVVTHLPELKSQFPNVLTIVKDRDGSHLELEAPVLT